MRKPCFFVYLHCWADYCWAKKIVRQKNVRQKYSLPQVVPLFYHYLLAINHQQASV